MRKFFAFVSGLLSGAMVGAVATLMLTPQSGTELKSQTRQRYNDMLDEGRKAGEARRQEVLDEFEALKRGQ